MKMISERCIHFEILKTFKNNLHFVCRENGSLCGACEFLDPNFDRDSLSGVMGVLVWLKNI